MKGFVVNVATGDHYVKGQKRLTQALGSSATMLAWTNILPVGSPSHSEVPYAFKAFALQDAAARGNSLLLWADASILPVGPLGPLFDRIYEDGYWISRNGWMNSEWTADSAYADLGISRADNAKVPHVVATAFGVNALHPKGRAILAEYVRLAKTRAFCGPWRNCPETPCGGLGVLGHRHDQSSLSVIAWKLRLKLTDPPEIFAYKGGEIASTVLLADGSYE
jgi:hypothetical protein